MTLGEESRRYDPRPSPALSFYTGTGHDGARGSGTRLSQLQKAMETRQQPEGDMHELSRASGKNPRSEQLAANSKTKTNQGKLTGKTCWRCGKSNHAACNCYFKGSKCRRCHERGHVGRVCKATAATAKHVADSP